MANPHFQLPSDFPIPEDLRRDFNDISSYTTKTKNGTDIPAVKDMLKRMEDRMKSVPENIIAGAFAQQLLGKRVIEMFRGAADSGDRYAGMIIEDMKKGKVHRITELGMLSALNLMRLRLLGQDNMAFNYFRDYIQTKYNQNVRDPDCCYMFLPARGTEGMDQQWESIKYLEEKGLIHVLETLDDPNSTEGDRVKQVSILILATRV